VMKCKIQVALPGDELGKTRQVRVASGMKGVGV